MAGAIICRGFETNSRRWVVASRFGLPGQQFVAGLKLMVVVGLSRPDLGCRDNNSSRV